MAARPGSSSLVHSPEFGIQLVSSCPSVSVQPVQELLWEGNIQNAVARKKLFLPEIEEADAHQIESGRP